MSYETFRHFADSYWLVFLTLVFVAMLVFIFRRGSSARYRRAGRIATDAPEHPDPSLDSAGNDGDRR